MKYPKTIVIYGYELQTFGIGKYPYDCTDKNKYPDAMIYKGDRCWTHSESEDFKERNKSLDVN